jgi:hypothetical protein
MKKRTPFIMSSMIVGIIVFQSALIAPAINELVSVNEASVFLRYIWPKFFVVIGTLAFVSIIGLFQQREVRLPTYVAAITLAFMVGCFLLTPVINNAKDAGNEGLWSALHVTTVLMTLVVLILNVWNLVYLSRKK